MEVHLPPLDCSRTRDNAVSEMGRQAWGLMKGVARCDPHTTPELGEQHRAAHQKVTPGGIVNVLKAGPLRGHTGLDALVGRTAEAAKCAQDQTLYHGVTSSWEMDLPCPGRFQSTIDYHCPNPGW